METAKEVADLVYSLPEKERLKQIIVTGKLMVDPLQIKLRDYFADIVVRGSPLWWPFRAFLQIDKLRDLVDKTTQFQTVLFHSIYDNWLKRFSSNTALSRLTLFLRSFLENNERAKMLLKPKGKNVIKPSHIWPSFINDEWTEIEVSLRDMISSEYAKKYNLRASKLTESEIGDYILGVETPALRWKRQRKEEIEQYGVRRIKETFTVPGEINGDFFMGAGTGSFLDS